MSRSNRRATRRGDLARRERGPNEPPTGPPPTRRLPTNDLARTNRPPRTKRTPLTNQALHAARKKRTRLRAAAVIPFILAGAWLGLSDLLEPKQARWLLGAWPYAAFGAVLCSLAAVVRFVTLPCPWCGRIYKSLGAFRANVRCQHCGFQCDTERGPRSLAPTWPAPWARPRSDGASVVDQAHPAESLRQSHSRLTSRRNLSSQSGSDRTAS